MKYWKDIAARFILLCLVILFYYPEGNNPLYSRYMFRSGSFERAAKLVNPEYNSFYWRIDWEKHSPLHEVIAFYSLKLFRNNLSGVVTFVFLGLALVAAMLTFTANRYFFSVLPSFFISSFLLFDRTLLPVVRGLGVISVLFPIPFALIFIRNLARSQERFHHWKKQLIPMTLIAVSIAVMYSLGGHETIFTLAFMCGFIFLLVLEGIMGYIREQRFPHPPTFFSLAGFAGGAILIPAIFALVFFNIYEDRQQTSTLFYENIIYSDFMKNAALDLRNEPRLARKNRFLLLRSTFIEGQYLTEHGNWHANTFLYPGEGFNGIIPLFLIPGLLAGLVEMAKKSLSLFKPGRRAGMPRPEKYFVMFNMVLLGLFGAVMYLSGDPKPTRYTFCIYSIYALSATGYETLFKALKKTAGKWMTQPEIDKKQTRLPTAIAISALLIVFVFAAKRLTKNYRDLQTYFQVYRNQIPSIAIGPVLAEAGSKPAKKFFIVHPEARHPSIGMMLGFKKMKNVRLISRKHTERVDKDWKEWYNWKNQYDKSEIHNSLFYIWDAKAKTFNVRNGEEISR